MSEGKNGDGAKSRLLLKILELRDLGKITFDEADELLDLIEKFEASAQIIAKQVEVGEALAHLRAPSET